MQFTLVTSDNILIQYQKVALDQKKVLENYREHIYYTFWDTYLFVEQKKRDTYLFNFDRQTLRFS